MSRKTVLTPFQSITNGDMSQSTITSLPTSVQYLDNISIELEFTGTPTGTFAIQVSNSYAQQNGVVTNAGTWGTYTLSPGPVASGSAGSIFIDINQTGFAWMRVVYTRTSGSGTLNCFIAGKEI